MGWFWADEGSVVGAAAPSSKSPPPACPMHEKPSAPQSPCPYVPPATTPSTSQKSSPTATLNALNPLNNMPADLSQTPESSSQTLALPVERETSSIPRGGNENESGNWVYPSPQQMYNAMIRKGYTAPADAVESMVAVHNFLNEGAWAEIVEWERRFGQGLFRGWGQCRYGEEGSQTGAMILPSGSPTTEQPKLLRFMGRSEDFTPKARMLQVMGWMYPAKYGGPPPFDRHDWFIERQLPSGHTKEVRYVIDYYSAPPEPTGEPVFYLDIRPALDRPSAAAERMIRWGRDVWWRASGAAVREGFDT